MYAGALFAHVPSPSASKTQLSEWTGCEICSSSALISMVILTISIAREKYPFDQSRYYICEVLHDLVSIAKFKKRENTHGGELLW